MLLPSKFTSFPFASVLQKSEAEQVAQNIMIIRKRLGDKWELSWADYKRERIKDGNFTMSEKEYFDQVMPLIHDEIAAIAFSYAWANAARKK